MTVQNLQKFLIKSLIHSFQVIDIFWISINWIHGFRLIFQVSQFFTDASLLALSGPYRSQSVPLHPRTLSSTGKPPLQNPLIMSTQLNMNLQKAPYPPTPCYTAPTPVPSELMDFADVTSNPSAALLGDTTSRADDNLNNYLIMFDDQTSTDDLSFQR